MSEKEDKIAGLDTLNDGSSSKRAKTNIILKDVISSDILSQDMKSLKKEFIHATPYPYGLLPNLFEPDFLKKVIREIKDNSVVNFKESDLFKVYQSIDLANLDQQQEENREKMPSVMQLRSVLYSPEWRRFMEDINDLGAGTLSEQVDCACNCHMTGCHLLCHDDVIGTRKISYILYLTEPEPEWTAVEGGALELYDSKIVDKERRTPDTVPSKTLLPIFNHMAFFVVEPGFSFHAVQEVLGDRPRLSLQGWYHAAEAPANIQDATLQRLKSYQGEEERKEEDTEGEYQSLQYPENGNDQDESKSLLDADRTYLSKYLHATYLKDEAIAEIRGRFEEDSSVQLRNFLSDTWVEKLKAAADNADENQNNATTDPTNPAYYQLGVSRKWHTVGPAHKQRFLEYSPSLTEPKDQNSKAADHPADAMGDILYCIRTELLESPPFGRFLGLLTSLGLPNAHRGRVRRFRPGRDYTVAHYGLLTNMSVLDATLCFCAGKGGEPVTASSAEDDNSNSNKKSEEAESEPAMLDEADEIWQSGDCGGFECYIAADDDDEQGAEPADEYDQDDDTELLSVSASNNTLSLVYRDPGTMRFIKYVGAKAPSSRWDVAMEYEVPDDDEEETNEEDNDGSKVAAKNEKST